MTASNEARALALQVPDFLRRDNPARYGWWSDRSLQIVKGAQTITLDADDIACLVRFVEGCPAAERAS